jgi:hypothetical protein
VKKAILIAIKRLTVMKFFPAGAVAQREIMRVLENMVTDARQLTWLVDTLIDSVDEWPGLRSVRGLFCTRYKPHDGKETDCSLPGFSAADCEGRAALEPATRLLSGTAEAPMSEAELRKFQNELFAPMLRRRRPPHSDFESLRRTEQQIAACKPTLSEAEKNRRIEEIEVSFRNQN